MSIRASLSPSILHRDGPTFDPTKFAEALQESRYLAIINRRRDWAKEPNGRQLRGLLCRCCNRPRRRATETRDERAPIHSITSSARARIVGGMIRPSAFADLRLMIRLTLVDCITGRSAGFSPLRIRPA